jgi:hypothetical protein
MNNIEKKKTLFYLNVSRIVKENIHATSGHNYVIQTYFTGRDDDFFGIDLTNPENNEILQFYVCLPNHSYELEGNEKVIFSRLSKINGKYVLQGVESVFFLDQVSDAKDPKDRLQKLIVIVLSNLRPLKPFHA